MMPPRLLAFGDKRVTSDALRGHLLDATDEESVDPPWPAPTF